MWVCQWGFPSLLKELGFFPEPLRTHPTPQEHWFHPISMDPINRLPLTPRESSQSGCPCLGQRLQSQDSMRDFHTVSEVTAGSNPCSAMCDLGLISGFPRLPFPYGSNGNSVSALVGRGQDWIRYSTWSDWHIGITKQMSAITKSQRTPACPCYSNPKNEATDRAFEGIPHTDPEES